MDCAEYQEENLEKKVCIVGSELVDNYTVGLLLELELTLAKCSLLPWLARYAS